MVVDNFLEARMGFSSKDLAAFLRDNQGDDLGIQQASIIRRWKRSGWIRSLRNGAYLVISEHELGERDQVLLAACEPRSDRVMGYHAALAYHLDLPLPPIIRVLTKTHKLWAMRDKNIANGKASGGAKEQPHGSRKLKLKEILDDPQTTRAFVPVRILPSKDHPGREHWGVIQPNPSASFRVTNLERSLVDVFDRPEFFSSIEDFQHLWTSLEQPAVLDVLANMDLRALSKYLKMVNCATTAAKVGYFLEGHWEKFHLTAKLMKTLERPDSQTTWVRGAKGGKYSSRWNLVVPIQIAAFEDLPREGNATERNVDPYTGDLFASLKEIFGYDKLRDGQEEILRAVLNGQDTLGILPTGAGKSLTYQLPAKLLNGVTLVISPLLSLMVDQAEEATERDINARSINSFSSLLDRDKVYDMIVAGGLDLLFIAPESLRGLARAMNGLQRHFKLIVIDEAHCIHDWGKTFRPRYRDLHTLPKRFPVPVLALTATANEAVCDDIKTVMGMRDVCVKKLSSFRRNLFLVPKLLGHNRRFPALLHYAKKHPKGGIIYCRSRAETEEVAARLMEAGFKAGAYHAKVSKGEKPLIQNAFKKNEIDIVVATTAFGMGVNKGDVRWVIHMAPPNSLSDYVQQVGRAGRDGKPAQCILMYTDTELAIMENAARKEDDEEMLELRVSQVVELKSFITSKSCRHQMISAYFGDVIEPCKEGGVGSCDICAPHLRPYLPSQPDENRPTKKRRAAKPKLRKKSQSSSGDSKPLPVPGKPKRSKVTAPAK